MRVRICVIFSFQYKFSNFFKKNFSRRKKDFIRISLVNFYERVNTHDQKEKFHQLKSKSIIIKLTCNKFAEY